MTTPMTRARALGARARDWTKPTYSVLIGDPMAEGRLRIEGNGPLIESMARFGLVTLLAALISFIFSDAWRAGDLIFLDRSFGRFEFLPEVYLPATLVALAICWTLLTWGAALATTRVAFAGAALFLLANSGLGKPLDTDLGGDSLASTAGQIAYFAVPAILVGYAALGRKPGLHRRMRIPALAALLIGSFVFFGAYLYAFSLELDTGFIQAVPTFMDQWIRSIENLLIPLVLISGIAIIEFGYDVADASVVPAWRLKPLHARIALGVLLVTKLWVQLINHFGEWMDFVTERPERVIAPIVTLGFFAVAFRFARSRRIHAETTEAAKEKLIYAIALAMALPSLIVMLVKAATDFALLQFNWLDAPEQLLGRLPTEFLFSEGELLIWVAMTAVGVYLMRAHHDSPTRAEVGFGLVIIGAWIVPWFFLELFDIEPPLRLEFLDLLITGLMAGYLAFRWRDIDSTRAIRLGAVTIFLWLLTTEGDFLAIVGGRLGLPGSFVVLFGVIFVLLADSSFASDESKHFPRPARLLMWIGYMLLSVVLLAWFEVTKGWTSSDNMTRRAFFYLGVPLAAWLLFRRPFTPPAERTSTSSQES